MRRLEESDLFEGKLGIWNAGIWNNKKSRNECTLTEIAFYAWTFYYTYTCNTVTTMSLSGNT